MLDDREKELSEYAIKVLKSEMGKNLIKGHDLAERLSTNPHSFRSMVNRGTFSAAFFLKVLQELGTKEIVIPSKEINKE